jgi:hypothetical protein
MARTAIVNIDKTVEITSPWVGIGVESIPISRDNNRATAIVIRYQGTSCSVTPEKECLSTSSFTYRVWPWLSKCNSRCTDSEFGRKILDLTKSGNRSSMDW